VTIAEHERKVLALERWARTEIAKLGPRPISVCPKPDDAIYAYVALLAQVAAVEAVMRDVAECLDAEFFHEPGREPSTQRASEVLAAIA
jgi:hypothetical protein